LKRNFEETEMKPFDYYSKPQTLYPNKKVKNGGIMEFFVNMRLNVPDLNGKEVEL
jgi:hypothetical protein